MGEYMLAFEGACKFGVIQCDVTGPVRTAFVALTVRPALTEHQAESSPTSASTWSLRAYHLGWTGEVLPDGHTPMQARAVYRSRTGRVLPTAFRDSRSPPPRKRAEPLDIDAGAVSALAYATPGQGVEATTLGDRGTNASHAL